MYPYNIHNVPIPSQVAKQVQVTLATRNFRVYTATDVIGAELCGALKNVLAIACGASDGFGFGANARAALITRGGIFGWGRVLHRRYCNIYIYDYICVYVYIYIYVFRNDIWESSKCRILGS